MSNPKIAARLFYVLTGKQSTEDIVPEIETFIHKTAGFGFETGTCGYRICSGKATKTSLILFPPNAGKA